jgi:hypothetical protein
MFLVKLLVLMEAVNVVLDSIVRPMCVPMWAQAITLELQITICTYAVLMLLMLRQ